ncbi:penicillin-binding protein 1A [Veronia pacifica]|uniref:Penicillin-binding protein 1A n=1 Tax=Veronia pacifica TaxID=1080227 RepID=A0A1C3EGK0_9GAMM|nr:PBP1A family penicillin-binding protein [Veronia pacifica]ODA32367.1 penicillin-sensitive transpeptidase [Veronia pacifica]
MKFIKRLLIFAIFCVIIGVTTIFGFYVYVKPELPDVATLKDVKLQTPMQVYSADGKLLSQFGEKRRIPIHIEDMPQHLIEAVIATEDARFYNHPGVDPISILRAAIVVAISGHAKQGASTITQQVARNFFLTNEKKIMRKIKEAFIAIHIEQLLTKDEILELYLNKIPLGYRSFGMGAAAQVYFGKTLNQLTLSEMAVLAGLPKAPSSLNPIRSVERATNRRNVVLSRMLDVGFITRSEYEQAKSEPVMSKYHGAKIEFYAPYVAEMARAWMVKQYGDEVYESGRKVYLTIDSRLQKSAQISAINNLLDYDQRHGYRGAVKTLWKEGTTPWTSEQIKDHLSKQPTYGDLVPAIVTKVEDKTATVVNKKGETVALPWDGIKWARRYKTDARQGPAPSQASDILAAGQQIWTRKIDDNWTLSQVPDANTAFVAVSPENGAIKALVGGFNYVHSKFNRATQSVRQVGSSIKPFIYSAAIDRGMTLATLVNDAPINHWDQSQGTAWRPKNSPPTYTGLTRMKVGLAKSKNVMAVRLLRRVGLDETIDYLTRFGFKHDELPRAEALALGAGSLTPLQMAQGYSVFANGGYYLNSFLIDKVADSFGDVVYTSTPDYICRQNCPEDASTETVDASADEKAENTPSIIATPVTSDEPEAAGVSRQAPHVITEQNAFLVREMMEANIWGGGDWNKGTGWLGTGFRARSLKRYDIGGKTGTTNDVKDAWYVGFGPGLVAAVWVGFDDPSRKLGRTSYNKNLGKSQVSGGEAGAKTSQMAWVNFMKDALADTPKQRKSVPSDIVRVRIDRTTGLLTRKNDYTSMFEYFAKGTEPKEYTATAAAAGGQSEEEELF